MNSKQIDFIYNKIFDTKLLYKLHPKKKKIVVRRELEDEEYRLEQEIKRKKEEEKPKKYIVKKINDIKNKVFFMKGIIDYSYPQIMVKKFKKLNESINEERNHKEKTFRQFDQLSEKMNTSEIENRSNVNLKSNLKILEINKQKINEALKKTLLVSSVSDAFSETERHCYDFNKTGSYRKILSRTQSTLDRSTMTKFISNIQTSRNVLKPIIPKQPVYKPHLDS